MIAPSPGAMRSIFARRTCPDDATSGGSCRAMTSALPSRLEPASEMTRHRHVAAYATLVLSGGYEEAGDAGRFRVSEGDILIHAPFSAHRDAIFRTGAVVLDLPLPFDGRDWPSRGRV